MAIVAVCCMIWFTIGIDLHLDHIINSTTEQEYQVAEAAWSKFMKIFGSTTAVFYTLLACALIFSFVVLNRALKKFAHHSLDETKKKIKMFFSFLVLGFILRSLFLDG